MAKEEVIETGRGAGGGGVGAKKDASAYRQSYAVKALTDTENLKLLSKLPVFSEENRKAVTFEMDELMSLGYTGDTTGAPMQMFNRIFDTLEVPFVAGTVARGGVKKVKVVRYGEEFDEKQYATTRAGRPSEKGGFVDHEDSPEGLVQALEDWLEETAVDFDVILLAKLGLDRKMKEMELLVEEEESEKVEE